MSDQKTVVVLWSGGADSTALILWLLDHGHVVHSLAVNHDQVLSRKWERPTREALRSKITRKHKNGNRWVSHRNVSTRGACVIPEEHGLGQAAIWFVYGAWYSWSDVLVAPASLTFCGNMESFPKFGGASCQKMASRAGRARRASGIIEKFKSGGLRSEFINEV